MRLAAKKENTRTRTLAQLLDETTWIDSSHSFDNKQEDNVVEKSETK